MLTPPAPSPTDEERRQEREVRLTAQRILTRHLHPGDNPRRPVHTFWPDTDLDLTAATLTDLDLTGCHLRTARFAGATFTGNTELAGATFTEDTEFAGATFTEDTEFGAATFTGETGFDEATFRGNARFIAATFTGNAEFYKATFTGEAEFAGATFAGCARFVATSFLTAPSWNGVRFDCIAEMRAAQVRIHPGQGEGPSSRSWPAGWAVRDHDRDDGWTDLVPVPSILPPQPRHPN